MSKSLNNITETLRDDLAAQITPGCCVSVAADQFSMYAYQALKTELDKVKEFRFIYTSPTFTKEKPEKRQMREWYIPRLGRERSLYGTDFELRLRHELKQKAVAQACADWRQGDGSGEGATAFSAAMAYKRMAAAGGAQLVTGLPYLLTDSLAPVALAERLSFDGAAMDHVYHSLLRAVAGDRLLGTEGLPPAEALALMLRREACDQEISRLEARLRREVQPSRQMALFSQLQQLKKQWNHLNTPPPPQTS